MEQMLTVISYNSHFPAKNMKRADKSNTDKSDKLQESIIKLSRIRRVRRVRVECGDNILGKHEAIWCGVSDNYKKEGEYAAC